MPPAQLARKLLAPGGMPGPQVGHNDRTGRREITPVPQTLRLAQRLTLGLPVLNQREQIPRLGVLEGQQPPPRLVHIPVPPQPRRVADHYARKHRRIAAKLHRPQELHSLLLVLPLRLGFRGAIEIHRHDRHGIVPRKLEEQSLQAVDERQALKRRRPPRALA